MIILRGDNTLNTLSKALLPLTLIDLDLIPDHQLSSKQRTLQVFRHTQIESIRFGCSIIQQQRQAAMAPSRFKFLCFSDIDGTLVHYLDSAKQLEEVVGDVLWLPKSTTGRQVRRVAAW